VASAIVTVMQSAQAGRMSPLRRAADARAARPPIAVASILAPRYPEQPIMSYIPGLAWSGALRLSQMTGDKKWRDKPRREMEPFITGAKPSIAEPYQLTSLAGHLALFDLAAIDDNPAARAVAIKAADFILPQRDGEIIRFPRQWTDDMFMATSILARAGAATGDAKYGAAAGRLLTQYAALLQRPDGIFIHAQDGPHAWGRGNGFAAFGLMEALAHLPRDWSDRAAVLAIFQKHMRGMRDRQAADGMWREVVDAPGSYREVTVTAQTLVAMARGVRLGWLDASFRGAVDRAWRALRLRVADDGTLVDVCTGTGAGPTLQYYLDRGAIFGADDRGGAMALQAALEMATPASR
jgi:rhamnogalacturonyl hydrolase YesR